MSERKVTDELRKAETVLLNFTKQGEAIRERANEDIVALLGKRSAYVDSLDPELVRKLRAIGVLEGTNE